MPIFLAICAAVCFAAAMFAGYSIRSDIQIGIVVTAAVGGIVLVGLAYATATLNEIMRRQR